MPKGLTSMMTLAAAVGWLGFQAISASQEIASTSPGRSSPQTRPAVNACAAQPDALQQMFVPLAHLRLFDSGEIVLNNNGVDPMLVRPVWFVTGIGPIAGTSVTVPPQAMGFHDLRELLPTHVSPKRVHGLLIRYEGKLLELGGQVVLRRRRIPRGGSSLDIPFSMSMDFKSARQEATWTASGRESSTLILANTTPEDIDVSVTSTFDETTVKIRAFESRLVDVVGKARSANARKQALWAVLTSSGGPGSLRATGLVGADGAARLIRFYDPETASQPDLFATRMRVAGATGDLALRNTSADPITARAMFLDTESGEVLVETAPVALSPATAQLVDLKPVFAALATHADLEAVSVRVESNGANGVLIGSMYTYEAKTGIAFDVPLRDSGSSRKSTGSYPWRIDRDYETRVSITNVGPAAAQVVARIAYDSGELVFTPAELKPGASALFDLRAVRDNQVADQAGNSLPPTASAGRFIWTAHNSGQSARLAGRAEVVSASQGVSSSYSCGQCCPDSFVVGLLSPFERILNVGTNSSYTVTAYYQTCYAHQYEVGAWPSWGVNYPSVASVYTQSSGNGVVSGLSSGVTDLSAYFGAETWYPYLEDCFVDYWQDQAPGRAEVRCGDERDTMANEYNPGVVYPGRRESQTRL